MIEICFQKKQEKKGFLFEYIRKIKQKRGVCKEICIRKGEQEYIRLELPVCYGEKVKSGQECFFKCLKKIKAKYPNQLIYIEKDVCRMFKLKPYEKQWICWYVLLIPIWQQLEKQYELVRQNKEIVLCDTKDYRSYYLFYSLVSHVKKVAVITDEPKRWEQIGEEYLQEYGIVVDICEIIELDMSGKVIIDLDGKFIKQYSKLEQENIILSFQLTAEQKAYLNCRLKYKNVICGVYQSVEGNILEEKYIAIYMQSMSWKLRQVANTQEVFLEEKELEELREQYEWKLAGMVKCNDNYLV